MVTATWSSVSKVFLFMGKGRKWNQPTRREAIKFSATASPPDIAASMLATPAASPVTQTPGGASPHGKALLYRGQWTEADQGALERALKPLRARICHRLQRELPAGRGLRTLLVLQPLEPCPAAYPRAVGLPAKQPLGVEAPP